MLGLECPFKMLQHIYDGSTHVATVIVCMNTYIAKMLGSPRLALDSARQL